MTPEELFEEASLKVWPNSKGAIVYDSVFEREWKAAGLDLDLLHGCIEDNLIDGENGEDIDWAGVRKDFERCERDGTDGT